MTTRMILDNTPDATSTGAPHSRQGPDSQGGRATLVKYLRIRRWLADALGTRSNLSLRAKLLWCISIFCVGFCARSLQAVDIAPFMYTNQQPMGGLTVSHQGRAVSILQGHGILVPDNVEPGDTALLSYAPAYSIYLAAIYVGLGKSYFTVQLIQNAITSLIPVLLFFIAGRLISWRVGIVAGFLAAATHATAYYSNLILPDSMVALPVLAALYLLVAFRRQAYWPYLLSGLMIGASVWLRANSLMLAPFLFVYLMMTFRWRRALAQRCALIVVAAVLAVTPIAVRNYLLWGSFVPLQIGTGIVLWEGIGEASGDRFGAVSKDDDVGRQEVALYGDPRYLWWATPDGIQRDRDRIDKSLHIIRSHPLWYAGVMIGRVKDMFNYSASAPMVEVKAPPERSPVSDPTETRGDAHLSAERQAASRAALAPGFKMRFMRWPVKTLQRLARETMLPFLLLGGAALLLLSPRRWVLLAAVPAYYVLFQSAMHTEFRYTLPMQYFLFIFAAVAWVAAGHSAYIYLFRGLRIFRYRPS